MKGVIDLQKIYFLDGKAVTKTQLLCDAEATSLRTKSKNKRRLREGLVFRMVKDYKTWGEFVGGCQQITYNSVPNINVKIIIKRALDSQAIYGPCIAVFRLNGQAFVYSEKGRPVIYNARVLIDRGGTWCKEEDECGNITDWYLADRDIDRAIDGEYLLIDKIDFPNGMSDEWRELSLIRYGQVCDKYHIVPERR